MATSEDSGQLAATGEWSDFDEDKNANASSGSSNGGKSDRPKTDYLIMDTSKPGKYVFKIRPVGAHVKCRKFFKPYKATLGEQDKDTDPAWKNGWWPAKRFAINVIDRADGKLKVLEKGASVFKGFANYKSLFGKNPSDVKTGADFAITVVVPKGKDGKVNPLKTEYTVTHIGETPLTEAEISMIKAQRLWPLTKIYKPTPLEKRIEMWNSLPETAKIAPKREESGDTKSETKSETKPVEVPAEEKMEGSPADSEDLFGDGEKSAGAADASAEMF